eukprot:m.9753 g.9753  ORF g.9753 m.9753 type:complete len:349 (-) comp4127_c0_seq1:1359-2405(-)
MSLYLDRVSFNQDNSCFAIGTDFGFAIYNSDPLRELVRRDLGHGVQHVAMLHRSNILALVGGGRDPLDSSNKVLIWDDNLQEVVSEIEFRMQVVAVVMRTERLIVATELSVFVFKIFGTETAPILFEQIETVDNPTGILAVSSRSVQVAKGPVLATLGRDQPGNVRLSHLDGGYPLQESKELKAHQYPIACLALSVDGVLLVTASERGKSVRVFDTKKQERLHEFKLGYLWGTPILCVSISLNGSYVCAGNERTIHVYDCNNPKVDLVFKPIQPCTCAFALNDGRNRLLDECYIFAICRNSSFFRYAFNPSKARTSPDQRLFGRLLKPDDSGMFKLMQQAKTELKTSD